MKKQFIILIISLTVIYTVNTIPQRQNGRQRRPNQNQNLDDQSLQDKIDGIFPPQTTQQSFRGADAIVTPVPNFTPTATPQVLTVNEQNCTCTPYHLCDPLTNTVRNPVNNDEVTGFGVIDIRFDPLDCQDVLDVCCVGAARVEEPIQPKPIENVPTQEAGCGVRNVGGLDFELAGAFVRDEKKLLK